MRIIDWSSDVCSSDLEHAHIHHRARDLRRQAEQEIAIGDVKNGHPGIGQHHRGRRDADLELPLTAGMRERELFEGSADRKLHRLLHQAEFDWAWSGKHMTHDSRRPRFPLLARPGSDASVRAVLPLARNIYAIDHKSKLFLLGSPPAR